MSPSLSPRLRFALPLAVVLLLAAGLWLAECAIARHDPGLLSRDPATGDDGLQFYRFHPEVGLFHRPSFSGEYRGVVYRTNAAGLRGPELDAAATRPRVLLLGDSLVWGFGVSEGETLRDALAALRPGSEFLNAGVAGFGTGQQWMLLRAEGLAHRPERVILFFTLANDVEDSFRPDTVEAYPANLFYLDAQGALGVEPFALSPWQRLGLWLRHNSHLVAWAASRSAGPAPVALRESGVAADYRRRFEAAAVDPSRYAGLDYLERPGIRPEHLARRGGLLPPSPASHYKVELVKQLLRAIARDTRAAGAEIAVVLAPFRAQLAGDPVLRDNPLTAELSRFLAAEGIAQLDLLPVFESSGARVSDLFVDGMHFSPLGNRVAAAAVAVELLTDDTR